MPSCARRWARSVAAIFALSSRRSSGCERSQAMTSSSASRYSVVFDSATGTTTWRLAGSCGSTSLFRRRTKQRRRRCQCRRSSDSSPRNLRVNCAPEPKSSRRPMTRSCATSSSAWLSTGVPLSASFSPPSTTDAASAPHRLRALGLRVLDVVRLVDDERARPQPPQHLAVGGDDLVVEDRDVGGRRDRHAALDERHAAVRQPVRGLALPVELQRRRADDDRRKGAVGLERRERLDGLAQTLLVGEKAAPRVQRVAHGGPLKRRELAAEHRRDLVDRLGADRARAADRGDRRCVLLAQRVEHERAGAVDARRRTSRRTRRAARRSTGRSAACGCARRRRAACRTRRRRRCPRARRAGCARRRRCAPRSAAPAGEGRRRVSSASTQRRAPASMRTAS